ncbi:PepSY domain-containing protein [Oceanobacillus sp. FSL W8-0428]|uniref:Peptidase M4 n=1 Tax=Oceanobacillus sojae TaxID=582851 RepID=A0A511ZKS0_9BACI|nr:PepSY domain-containing protein [Oceanobacillus sojae]GEN88000.1 peptidase M4 [Oceanobacillus sojae]
MSKKKVLLAAAIGIAIGYIAREQVSNQTKITPEKALNHAKEMFKRNGPISGSWIYMKPEELERNGLLYDVYRGGVTRNIDGANKQFDFYVDIETGAVIDTEAAV